MGILIIDQWTKATVAAMIERARKKPVLVGTVMAGAVKDQDSNTVTLADRPPGMERPPSEHLVLGSYRVAFSFEQQPAGMCRHLSISTRKPGSVPNVPVINEIMALFGFTATFREGEHITEGRAWLEEFDPGHYAFNVVEFVDKPQVGHA